jgi:hypothetical protein
MLAEEYPEPPMPFKTAKAEVRNSIADGYHALLLAMMVTYGLNPWQCPGF